jgi:hypothetical protein
MESSTQLENPEITPEPGFYEFVFGRTLAELDLDTNSNHVIVDNIEAKIRLAEQFDNFKVFLNATEIFDMRMALIKCPDNNIIILIEETIPKL